MTDPGLLDGELEGDFLRSGRCDSNPRRPAWEAGGKPRTDFADHQFLSSLTACRLQLRFRTQHLRATGDGELFALREGSASSLLTPRDACQGRPRSRRSSTFLTKRGLGVTPWIAQPPGPVGGPTGPHVIGLNGAGGSRFTSERTLRLCALTSATFPAARRPTGSTLPYMTSPPPKASGWFLPTPGT